MHTPIPEIAAFVIAAYAATAGVQAPPSSEGSAKPAREQATGVFRGDLEALARNSDDFRRVLHTATHSQLVLMSLRPGENIGVEVHDVDQCLFIVDGKGQAIVNGKRSPIDEDSVVCVPAGASHDIVNHDDEPMKLFTVYAPPQHPKGTVHRTKADAQRAEQSEHGAHRRPSK